MLGSPHPCVCVLAMSADDSVSVTDATVDLFRTWNAKAHWSAGRKKNGEAHCEAVSVFLTISGIVSRL